MLVLRLRLTLATRHTFERGLWLRLGVRFNSRINVRVLIGVRIRTWETCCLSLKLNLLGFGFGIALRSASGFGYRG